MNNLISEVKQAVKYWWVSLVIGIFALIVGIWSLCTPIETFVTLTILFIVMFFAGGILEIVFAISNRRNHGWGWTLVMGILDIIFAILLVTNMALTPLIFSYFIAFWILFRSIWGISVAIDLKNYSDSGWGWLLALSITGVLLSAFMLFIPVAAASFAVYFVGFALIFYGVFRIYLAFSLKRFGGEVKDFKNNLER